jgi:mono/diheme cytochrome c family protein
MRALSWFACLAIGLAGSVALAQEAGDPAAGHAFARSLCAVCHAVDADGGDSPNSSAPTFTRIAAEPGMTATALSVILRNPHRKMPDLILTPEERTNVIAYILTLKPQN